MVAMNKGPDGAKNSVEFYNKLYSDEPGKWDLELRDRIAFYVISRHIVSPKTFLDIGCGTGHTIEYFKMMWPKTTYIGMDLSDEAIKLAKKRVPDVEFLCTSFEDADPLMCTVVVLMGVAEHFEELEKSLRRLKKFGRFIYIESPNCLHYSDNKKEGFRRTDNELGQPEWHLHRKTWVQKIKAAGLEVVESWTGLDRSTEFVWMLK